MIVIPPHKWFDYPLEELEFTVEFTTENVMQDDQGSQYELERMTPAELLDLYIKVPEIEKFVNKCVRDKAPRCCSGDDAAPQCWSGCAFPGTICPLFEYAETPESSAVWERRARHLKVTAWRKV